MRIHLILCAASLAVLSGCVQPSPTNLGTPGGTDNTTSGNPSGSTSGTPGGTGGGPAAQTAREYFDANVLPVIDDGAGNMCATCHSSAYPAVGPDYLGAGMNEYYSSLVSNTAYVNANPDNSSFLNTAEPGSGHYAEFTGGQAQAVYTWLQKEAEERFDGQPANTNADELIDKFGACMKLDEWTTPIAPATKSMADLAITTTQSGPCQKCHTVGTYLGNNIMDSTSASTIESGFAIMQMRPYIYNLVQASIDPGTGQVTGIEQSYRWRDKAYPPPTDTSEHPKNYLIDQAAIDAWFDQTMKCVTP